MEPLAESPDVATPRDDFDETLGRAIDAGHLDPAQAADPKLAAAFAAHQKLASLFALLRNEPADIYRERPPWRSDEEPPPTRLGRYEIIRPLGADDFGTVYLARDPELNRDVAIKVSNRLSRRVRAGAGADNDPLSLRGRAGAGAVAEQLDPIDDRMAAEARHAASLNHPSIVAIYDVGREGDRLYIVMQYIAGRTLADLAREGPLPPARAAELLATVADALHYAHKQGFVHRDLKPANILLDEQGNPHITDFGLAVSEETQRALAGQVAGTPAYMSPEQCRGAAHHLDGRTDIWSLGVIGYELITGRHPFWNGDVLACLDAIQHRDPKPPRQIDDTVLVELERIILKCLAKQPTDRYYTAGDVAADLRPSRKSRSRRAQRNREATTADPSTISGATDESSIRSAQYRPDRVNNVCGWKPVLRWIACVPAAITAAIAIHVVVLIGNRLSLEFQFLNPDSVFGNSICFAMSSLWPGYVSVTVAAIVAPRYDKLVAIVAAGAILFLSGLTAYAVILTSDWWGGYQLVWANIGSVAAAYVANEGDREKSRAR